MRRSSTQSRDEALERLFRECATQAWRLAYSYLRRPHDAYDAVQQAFLVAASKADRIPSGSTWPWFSVVVFHEARNARRRNERQAESLEARGEGQEVSVIDEREQAPEDTALKAEAHDSLWQAIDSLPEMERTAIVLTHISGMTHASAAAALLMPAKTLSSHVSRALARLRQKFSASDDSIAKRLAAIPIVVPPGGWESALTTWKAATASMVATSSASGSIGGAAATLNSPGAAVPATYGSTAFAMNKALLASGIAAALGIGIASGIFFERNWIGPASPSAVTKMRERGTPGNVAGGLAGDRSADAGETAESPAAAAPSSNAAPVPTPEPLAELETLIAALKQENETLRADATVLQAQLAEAKQNAPAHSPVFTFGEAGQLAEIRSANWPEMAQASQIVASGIVEFFEYKERGETAPEQIMLAVQENTEKVRKYEYRTIGKLPTAAQYNGELTHPISVANMVAALLLQAEFPLSDAQIKRISRIGEIYEESMARIAAAYREDTLRVQRLLEEYLLKGEFTDQLLSYLSEEQRAVFVNPKSHRDALLDVYSPTLMLVHSSPIVTGSSVEELQSKLKELLVSRYSLSAVQAESLPPFIAEWTEEVASLLEPVAKIRARHYSFEDGIVAGRASVELLTRLLETLELEEASRKKVLDEAGFFIPRITIAEEPADKSA